MSREFAITHDSVKLYNTNFGCITFGFINGAPFIKLASVKDEFKGKKPRPGDKIYDYDKSIMMTLTQSEMAILIEAIPELITNKVPMISFSHKSGNYISLFQIGVGLDGKSKKLQICMSKSERDAEEDDEPLSEAWYEFQSVKIEDAEKTYNAEATVLKIWLIEALKVSMNVLAHSVAILKSKGSNDNRSGRNNDRFEGRRRNDDDDEEEDRPRNRRPSRRNDDDDEEEDRPRAKKKKAVKSSSNDDDDGGAVDEDGIPF